MPYKFTDFIAIYAALLSTLVFVWNFRNSQPRFKVELFSGFKEQEHGVFIDIKNPSSQVVIINVVWLLFPLRTAKLVEKVTNLCRFKRLPHLDWVRGSIFAEVIATELPVSLAPRNSHRIFIPEAKIREMLQRTPSTSFAAGVRDALGGSKYSSPLHHHIPF
jgi:hypothetical protein